MVKKVVVLLALLGSVLLAACGAVVRPQSDFLAVSSDYFQRLRWQDYNGAARYLAPQHREPFVEAMLALEGLRITEVEVAGIEFQDQGRRAVTRAVVDYYLLPSVTVQRYRLRQEWAYLGGDRYHPGAWQLSQPFPPFP